MELKHNDKTYIRQYENHQTELILTLFCNPIMAEKAETVFRRQWVTVLT